MLEVSPVVLALPGLLLGQVASPAPLTDNRCVPTPLPAFSLSDATPEELMERYLGGDEQAFVGLYRQISPRLLGYLISLTRNREMAEDLVQVTFTKVHRARESYLVGSPVLPWTIAIARRSFLDECRRRKVRPEDLTREGIMPDTLVSQPDTTSDLAEALELALQKCPPQYAEAIRLTKVTGLSIEEAAKVLGSTKAAVKLRVHRGYAILRRELEAYGCDL